MASDAKPRFRSRLAVFGTASDVGKSLLTAAFGRLLSDAGFEVAPFKAQNMSNNSYVALDGGEIGRAQYVQALACRCQPSVHHNPVLLKPSADDSSQVILRGQALGNTRASEYFADNRRLREVAYDSLRRLCATHRVVVLEGAGSCAEVNLRSREFVNFPAAHAAEARVILVADIDKGGVFAQVVGSLEVMPPEDRARVCGVIVNKFRGDRRLFDDGVTYLEQRTGLPVLGVVPFLYGFELDSEDAVPLSLALDPPAGTDAGQLKIAVLRLPHISNFTDFDALARTEGVAVHYIYRPRDLSDYDAVILPGTKSVAADLAWLRETGHAERVLQYHRQGGKLVGICGGLQALGERIVDDHGVESDCREVSGLGVVPALTQLRLPKIVRRVRGRLCDGGQRVSGYEIHVGRTTFEQPSPLIELDPVEAGLGEPPTPSGSDGGAGEPSTTGASDDAPRLDGFIDDGRRVWLTYLHGVFDEPAARHAFLRWVEPGFVAPEGEFSRDAWIEGQLDAFAAHVRAHVDVERVFGWLTDP